MTETTKLSPPRIWQVWTVELKSRARKMRDEGCSAREIADALGVSRNSVCGMIHRERWSLPQSHKNGPHRKRANVPRPPAVRHPGRTRPLHNGPPVMLVEPVAFPPLERTEPVHLLDLEPHHCRWPGEHMYSCGAPRLSESSYCAHHHQMSRRGSR